jgi:hypothetical protein
MALAGLELEAVLVEEWALLVLEEEWALLVLVEV